LLHRIAQLITENVKVVFHSAVFGRIEFSDLQDAESSGSGGKIPV